MKRTRIRRRGRLLIALISVFWADIVLSAQQEARVAVVVGSNIGIRRSRSPTPGLRFSKESDLTTVSLRDASTRGQKPVTSYPFLLGLQYAFSSGDVAGVPFLNAVVSGVNLTIRRFVLGASFGFAPTAFENARVTVRQFELPILGRIGREFPVRLFLLHVGVLGGATWFKQNLSYVDAAALETSSVTPPTERIGWIPETGGFVSFYFPIVERLAAMVEGDIGAKWVPLQEGPKPEFSGRISLGLGVRF